MYKLDINNIDNIDYFISEKLDVRPLLARKWKWRILNEYPDDLKNAVITWIQKETITDVEYYGISLERIMKRTNTDILNAADLLYIISKDPNEGFEIYRWSCPRDRIVG